ncbi:MAG: metallophosphoesterase [Acidobacteriaceae bacterium]|nr:metallophosphoesterase [Acidobacteriaceae bacterium]
MRPKLHWFRAFAWLLFPLCALAEDWHFAVSGDSRNCGDVVMPAIAKAASANDAAFYWHLGDFRAIYLIDQDYAQQHNPADAKKPPSSEYLASAWQDFIDNQLKPFGSMPVFLAFGNHELISPTSKAALLSKFVFWLDTPTIAAQRLKDNSRDFAVNSYYHWIRDGIDFITLDNSADTFDEVQLNWIWSVLTRDEDDANVRALVLGMHEALPESLSRGHSMSQTIAGEESGIQVYHWLLDLRQRSKKPVYLLASHSHYFLPGLYDTEYWREHGGVLPGWIIGAGGAERYALPSNAPKAAKTNAYGFLVATVSASKDDPLRFDFHELKETDVPPDVSARFTPAFVHNCWADNSQAH